MPSKVRVDATICDNSTTIVVKDIGGGKVSIDIDTNCPSVAHFAGLLKEADMDDLTDWTNNRILDLASRSGLTTTCLVPTAIFNCAWVELGMISKTLAKGRSPLCLHFVE
jgi:Family of unknown function (DUF6951)